MFTSKYPVIVGVTYSGPALAGFQILLTPSYHMVGLRMGQAV